MKNVTSDKRNLWMFPLGTVGRDMIYNLFTNFIFTYILLRAISPPRSSAR